MEWNLQPAYLQTASLTDGIERKPLVSADHRFVLQPYFSGLHVADIPFEERFGLALGEEAEILAFAVTLLFIGNVELLRERKHICLLHAAERKEHRAELLLVEPVEVVTLVFLIVDRFQHYVSFRSVALGLCGDARVVTGSESVAMAVLHELDQFPEFDRAVTADAGVRCQAVLVIFQKRIDDVAFKFFLEVEDMKLYAESTSYRVRSGDCLSVTALAGEHLRQRRRQRIRPEREPHTDHVVSFALQKMSDDGGIYAPGHCNEYSHGIPEYRNTCISVYRNTCENEVILFRKSSRVFSMQNHLNDFIAHARKKGMDHSTIRMLLLSSGWKEKEIAQALSAEGLDMQVPTPPDVGGAREAFMHLLSFASLYTLVISSVVLFFQYINRAFPDAAVDYNYSSNFDFSGIRWGMAAIIVSYPLLLWMVRLIHKEITKHPEKAWSGIRRWLTYITLFVAASSLMVDVIVLVFSLLEGELSVRFLLKVFTVFVIAGLTFIYYFLSLKTETAGYRKLNRNFFAAASSIVALAFVWGVVIVGSPGAERERKFDERRLTDLRQIHNEIYSIIYDDRTPKPVADQQRPVRALPQSLSEMTALALYTYPETTDPETGEPYEYRVLGTNRFALCAAFNFVRQERYDIFWNHPVGRHCYEFSTLERNYY